jgi:hypothetical protein
MGKKKSAYQNERKPSAYTANQDLKYLRATFNFGIEQKLISKNPTDGIKLFPVEKKIKHVPSTDDIDKVIAVLTRTPRTTSGPSGKPWGG